MLLRRLKASKWDLESESGVGNVVFFRMVRKESLWPRSRGKIWPEMFLKDYIGYCVKTRLLGNQLGEHCKKYCTV